MKLECTTFHPWINSSDTLYRPLNKLIRQKKFMKTQRFTIFPRVSVPQSQIIKLAGQQLDNFPRTQEIHNMGSNKNPLCVMLIVCSPTKSVILVYGTSHAKKKSLLKQKWMDLCFQRQTLGSVKQYPLKEGG